MLFSFDVLKTTSKHGKGTWIIQSTCVGSETENEMLHSTVLFGDDIHVNY